MTMTLRDAAEVIATHVGGTLTPSGTHHAIQLVMINRDFAGDAVARAEAQELPADCRKMIAAAREVIATFHIGLPAVVACTKTMWDDEADPTAPTTTDESDGDRRFEKLCGKPATKRVTITGADQVKNPTESEQRRPTSWNLDKAPRCDACARMDHGVVRHLYAPGWKYSDEPITAAVPLS